MVGFCSLGTVKTGAAGFCSAGKWDKEGFTKAGESNTKYLDPSQQLRS